MSIVKLVRSDKHVFLRSEGNVEKWKDVLYALDQYGFIINTAIVCDDPLFVGYAWKLREWLVEAA